jgi:hypothetical protein
MPLTETDANGVQPPGELTRTLDKSVYHGRPLPNNSVTSQLSRTIVTLFETNRTSHSGYRSYQSGSHATFKGLVVNVRCIFSLACASQGVIFGAYYNSPYN